jgi:hypothetical protein
MPLAPYAGTATTLFDDQVDPGGVGLAAASDYPRTDGTLRARTQNAEIVTRARVATVSADSAGGTLTYHLSLTFLDRPLVSRGFGDDHVEIAIRQDSPAFGVVKWLDTRLVGRTFVGFFHRYAGADDAQIRFHLSPDNAETAAAVRDALTLGEMAGR